MCGIFGLIVGTHGKSARVDNWEKIQFLFELAMSRGQDASGISVKDFDSGNLSVFRINLPPFKMFSEESFGAFKREYIEKLISGVGFSIIGHSRMGTNGADHISENNQPVVKGLLSIIHNGIIVNHDELWSKLIDGKSSKISDVDTEALAAVIEKQIPEDGGTDALISSVMDSMKEVKGQASIALQYSTTNETVIASNNGSLYFSCIGHETVFASERRMIERYIERFHAELMNEAKILQADSSAVYSIDAVDNAVFRFDTQQDLAAIQRKHPEPPKRGQLIDRSPKSLKAFSNQKIFSGDLLALERKMNLSQYDFTKMRRCTRCVLPETFPYIQFDSSGVCNYCRGYQRKPLKGTKEALREKVLSKKNRQSQADCIVSLSGGRDSSYGLHYVVKEMGLKPITFTYDWGMVTDLARRNISRMCSELKVENILISANIRKKRENIRKNVSAWMKRPDLGVVPLFMAGDKWFIYYANEVKRQTNISLDIWSANKFENTDFKLGFCGVKPIFNKDRPDEVDLSAQFAMPAYYAKAFVQNPRYLNSSLVDTIGAYWSYYFSNRGNFTQLFDFVEWSESVVEDTLINEYGWEVSPVTKSTWRIGDGTAAFYNYIYLHAAGFTEFDTFRSNQVREGVMTRETALSHIERENQPNLQGLVWYCDTIGVDVEAFVRAVKSMRTRY